MKSMAMILFPVLLLFADSAGAYECGQVYKRGINHFPVTKIFLMGAGQVDGQPQLSCYVAAFETGIGGVTKTRSLVIHFCRDRYSYQEISVDQFYNGFKPHVDFIREERELTVVSESPFRASGKVVLQQRGRSGFVYSSPDTWYRARVYIDERSGKASGGADYMAGCNFKPVQDRAKFFRE